MVARGSIGTPAPFALDEAGRALLDDAVGRAWRTARSTGRPTLAAVTVALPGDVDPTAVAWASRRPGEPWWSLEQPDRGGSALATLGRVRSLEATGPDRFAAVADAWRSAVADAAVAVGEDVAGPGLRAVGGFAFADDGGSTPLWSGFAPAALAVPAVALTRGDGRAHLTVATEVAPDDVAEEAAERVHRRLAELRAGPLPLLDPAPTRRPRVASVAPPEHFVAAVGRAVERIRAGDLEKVVLAREVDVHAPDGHDPGALLGVLREAFPSCYVFAAGTGEATFLGATPELLVRREGQRASTVALAGSIRRSADPAVDDHLAEQLRHSAKDREEHEIVARRIERTLRSHAVWVTPGDAEVVRIANIQHLATPIRAQLAEALGAVDLVGALHPTPAVGGEPRDAALPLIPALEGLDRGWYGGALGWVDAAEDGEFCVALRCALIRGEVARCYAGGGIVADSDPAAELAETEVKLETLLPLLAG